MMTLEEMRMRKKQLKLTNAQIAERSGIPVSTLQKILGGRTASPRYSTLQALEKVLQDHSQAPAAAPLSGGSQDPGADILLTDGSPSPGILCEGASAYAAEAQREDMPAKKKLTIADRDALPDYPITELIDGVIYDMSSPRTVHQIIEGEIFSQLRTHLRQNGGPCIPFINPTDVVLDNDDYTVVVPDVFVICDREKIKELKVYGAPDLIIEVLSPSTKKKDQSLKLYKYLEAGVREYWLIDPAKRTVVVYDMEAMREDQPSERAEITLYGFDDQIPVRIWDGEFCVDMKSVSDYLASIGM